MFYHLFVPFADYSIAFNVFRYVTFRSIAAFITALLFSLFIGPKIIRSLKAHSAVETIDEDVPAQHRIKQGTPTMGGLIILCGLMISSLLWNNLTNSFILIMYLTTIWLGVFGFLDDYLKNFVKSKKGLIPRYKLLGQISLAILLTLAIYYSSPNTNIVTTMQVPFLKNTYLQLGYFFFPIVLLMIVGTSNAVNLTDGLDGLASGITIFAALGLGIMSYLKGNFVIANYLNLEYIYEAGELIVFISALIGTLIGFLWYNSYPAEIFMGDTGSLSLGGILAVLAVMLREQLFFVIVGGLFFAETLSVIAQRYYFKYTKRKFGAGRRIFLCAPLHHHYEMQGMHESKIVIRFWIIAIMLAAIGLSTIKLR
jgi:phospho-N-acetylmuramoyl-pentapeptide-transferase